MTGEQIDFSPAISVDDTLNQFSMATSDPQYAGTFPISYRVVYDNYPNLNGYQSDAFTLTTTDVCVDSVTHSVTPVAWTYEIGSGI